MPHARPAISKPSAALQMQRESAPTNAAGEAASSCSDLPPPPRWIGFASGVVAGATGVLVGHAFDTLKVQAQVGAGPSQAASSASEPALRRVLALYRGILPPLLTTGGIRSIYFGVFENIRASLADSSLRATTAAAGVTGLLTAPVTQPFVTLKVYQQVNGGSLPAAVSKIWAARGHRGFFPGFGLHCFLETIGSTVYLGVYHLAKRALRSEDGTESVGLRVASGALAGCTAWTTIYPVDVLRSRIMALAAGDAAASGLVASTAQEVYRSGGARAFYRGISMTLLRAGPVAGVLLPVNDLLYDALARRARLG